MTAPRSFFHCYPAEEDPGTLLDPEEQVTAPGGGIAVFPRREGLYRYLAWKNDAEVVRSIRSRTGEEDG